MSVLREEGVVGEALGEWYWVLVDVRRRRVCSVEIDGRKWNGNWVDKVELGNGLARFKRSRRAWALLGLFC